MLIKAELHLRAVRCKHIYDSSQCNVICALIGLAKCNTLIAGAYRPANTSSYDSQLLIQHLSRINDIANVHIIVRDFNLPYTDWLNAAYTKRDGISDTFQATLYDLGFFNVSRSRRIMLTF